MDSNHQFGLPYHAVTIPASLKTRNNFNAHSARRTLRFRSHSPKELPASRVDTVDLVVMAAVWKREHFAQEVGMPVGVFGAMDLPGLELRRLRRHSIHLVAA
jgi:hypothetical protein